MIWARYRLQEQVAGRRMVCFRPWRAEQAPPKLRRGRTQPDWNARGCRPKATPPARLSALPYRSWGRPHAGSVPDPKASLQKLRSMRTLPPGLPTPARACAQARARAPRAVKQGQAYREATPRSKPVAGPKPQKRSASAPLEEACRAQFLSLDSCGAFMKFVRPGWEFAQNFFDTSIGLFSGPLLSKSDA